MWGGNAPQRKARGTSRPVEMIMYWMPSGQVVWYENKGQDFLDNGYLGNHVVFSIQDWKSGKVATPPPIIYRIKDQKSYRRYKALMKADDVAKGFQQAMVLKGRALEEIEDTELSKVLARPNPYMGWKEFAYGTVTYKDIVGSGYWLGVRDGINDPTKGRIKEIWLPPAHQMQIVSGGIQQPIKEYFLTNSPDKKIAAENVRQLRNFSPRYDVPSGWLYGLSRLHAANSILKKYNEGTAVEVDVYQRKGIRDILFPKGGDGVDAPTLEETQAVKDKFNAELSAVGHGGIMANNQELGSIRVGLSPTELGILESQKITKQDFCALYHIPDVIFSWDARSTYNNLSESRKIALTDAVLPELEALKEAINDWLVPSYYPNGDVVVDFDYEVFPELQEDIAEKVKWMNEANCLTTNEKRVALRYDADPDPNADKIVVASGMQFLEDVGTDSFETDPEAANTFTDDK